MLHDTSSKPLKRLAASEGYDFLLRHDVKEPNDHVLTFRCAMLLHMHMSTCVTCATWPWAEAPSQLHFNRFHAVRHTQQGMAVHGLSSRLSSSRPRIRCQSVQRCYLLELPAFVASCALCSNSDPAMAEAAKDCLQTRTVARQVFVEVCVENQSATAPLFLEYVRLEPSASAGPVDQLSPATAAPASKLSASLDAAAFLQQHIAALTVVQPNGAHNLLYQMPSPPPQAFSSAADGKADIGRLEIKWRRSMGEVQCTAHIVLCSSDWRPETRVLAACAVCIGPCLLGPVCHMLLSKAQQLLTRFISALCAGGQIADAAHHAQHTAARRGAAAGGVARRGAP